MGEVFRIVRLEERPVTMIRVRPAQEKRRAFARWAVQQVPKIRTCSEVDFAVPDRVFTHMPDELLHGALIDGHPYVPVEPAVEHQSEAAAAFGALGGTDEPDRPAVLEANTQANTTASKAAEADGQAVCEEPGCGRVFDSPRGVAAHQRRAHKKQEHTDGG